MVALVLSFLALSMYFYFVFFIHRGIQVVVLNQPTEEVPPLTQFSIVIAAHNEEEKIGATIASLVNQNYSRDRYEIILAADRCEDATVTQARAAAGDFPNLTILEIKETPPGYSPKKFALQEAISRSQFSYIVAMDADCVAAPDYLITLNTYFALGANVVLNIPKVRVHKKWLHFYLLSERLLTWGIATAAVGIRKPFLAFGGSWAYPRQLLEKVGGFRTIAHSLGGDDDLLVSRMAQTGANIRICLNPRGWVTTDLPSTWRAFFRQRRRHHSVGKFYPPEVKMGYLLFHLSNLLLWALPFFQPLSLLPLSVKFLADYFTLTFLAQVFRETLPLRSFLIFEPGYLLHHLLIAPTAFLGKISWK